MWKTIGRFVGFVLGMAFMLGLGTLFLGAGVYSLSEDTTLYEPVEAAVTKFDARLQTGAPNTGTRDMLSVYYNVAYRYTVDGQTYSGMDSDTSLAMSRRAAQEYRLQLGRDYAPGKRIEVFYNPREPRRNALRRESKWVGLVALLFGVMFVGSAILAAFGDGLKWMVKRFWPDRLERVMAGFNLTAKGLAALWAVGFGGAILHVGYVRDPAGLVLVAACLLLAAGIVIWEWLRRRRDRRPAV